MTLVPKTLTDEKRAELAIDAGRAEIAAAETPADLNRVRLQAELLCKALEHAAKDGSARVAELHRQAQILYLEAALSLGESALIPASEAGGELVGYRPRPRKDLKALAENARVPLSSLRDMANLALGRRTAEGMFQTLVVTALDKGKPIPLGKLRALAKGAKPDDDGDDPDKPEQIAFRPAPDLLPLIDHERRAGTPGAITRTELVRRAVEAYLRPTEADGVRLFQRSLLKLDYAPRLRAKIAFADEEAQFLLERFGGRAYKAIASATAGALQEVTELAPPPPPAEETYGDE